MPDAASVAAATGILSGFLGRHRTRGSWRSLEREQRLLAVLGRSSLICVAYWLLGEEEQGGVLGRGRVWAASRQGEVRRWLANPYLLPERRANSGVISGKMAYHPHAWLVRRSRNPGQIVHKPALSDHLQKWKYGETSAAEPPDVARGNRRGKGVDKRVHKQG
ncbi:hypothetical protein B0J13DRAFT_326006 [Dactylonectria estremocensis]|uniref:Uncharacterized protein n=1 Tax=Dactylonectria estremocensis TaxID=1079267 RepID=A0A9P9EVF2_9HYPO|nr:hypothetical protein B0J13DRAFT_326006 [Dactylonectria estremocensis]